MVFLRNCNPDLVILSLIVSWIVLRHYPGEYLNLYILIICLSIFICLTFRINRWEDSVCPVPSKTESQGSFQGSWGSPSRDPPSRCSCGPAPRPRQRQHSHGTRQVDVRPRIQIVTVRAVKEWWHLHPPSTTHHPTSTRRCSPTSRYKRSNSCESCPGLEHSG